MPLVVPVLVGLDPDYERLAPITPARAPTPNDAMNDDIDEAPNCVPTPRECSSVPATRRYADVRIAYGRPSEASSMPTSALASRIGSARPIKLPKLVHPDKDQGQISGPGMYNICVSRTGLPLGVAKGTTRFGTGERFDREKCYDGKENAMTMRGAYGPGMYDARVSRTGSPLWKGQQRPSAAFALPHIVRRR